MIIGGKDFWIDIHEVAPPEGGDYGEPPILAERDAECTDCGKTHDMERCPQCGADIMHGFGLGFGPGIGQYKVCEQFCGWSWKRVLPEE